MGGVLEREVVEEGGTDDVAAEMLDKDLCYWYSVSLGMVSIRITHVYL